MKFTATDSRLQTALDLLCVHAPLYTEASELSVNWFPNESGNLRWAKKENVLMVWADSVSDALFLVGRALTELDEPELPYRGILSRDGHTPGRELYGEIVTANTLCHQFSI